MTPSQDASARKLEQTVNEGLTNFITSRQKLQGGLIPKQRVGQLIVLNPSPRFAALAQRQETLVYRLSLTSGQPPCSARTAEHVENESN